MMFAAKSLLPRYYDRRSVFLDLAANLRRVTDRKTGDVLWVCAKHYVEYDPGLPVRIVAIDRILDDIA